MTVTRLDSGFYVIDGRRLPSVTKVLGVLLAPAFGHKPYYAERGSEVHDVIAHLQRGYEIDDMADDIQPFVQAWMRFRDEMGYEPELVEEMVVSTAHGYAGTLDAVGVMRRAKQKERTLFDWKTSAGGQLDRLAGPQTAAYLAALREHPEYARLRRRTVVVLDAGGNYRLYDMGHWARDLNVFISCLNIWKFREEIA